MGRSAVLTIPRCRCVKLSVGGIAARACLHFLIMSLSPPSSLLPPAFQLVKDAIEEKGFLSRKGNKEGAEVVQPLSPRATSTPVGVLSRAEGTSLRVSQMGAFEMTPRRALITSPEDKRTPTARPSLKRTSFTGSRRRTSDVDDDEEVGTCSSLVFFFRRFPSTTPFTRASITASEPPTG